MAGLKHPLFVFAISLAVSLSAWIGTLQRRRRQRGQDVREYGVVENPMPTRLGLIVAFAFSWPRNLDTLAASLHTPAVKP